TWRVGDHELIDVTSIARLPLLDVDLSGLTVAMVARLLGVVFRQSGRFSQLPLGAHGKRGSLARQRAPAPPLASSPSTNRSRLFVPKGYLPARGAVRTLRRRCTAFVSSAFT